MLSKLKELKEKSKNFINLVVWDHKKKFSDLTMVLLMFFLSKKKKSPKKRLITQNSSILL
jgi:hypothetical protein